MVYCFMFISIFTDNWVLAIFPSAIITDMEEGQKECVGGNAALEPCNPQQSEPDPQSVHVTALKMPISRMITRVIMTTCIALF